MLVISPNLVLTDPAEAALPPGTPMILWDNMATFGTVISDSEAEGYPATNLTNPATNQEWRAIATGDVEWTFTPGSADDIDAVGIARHNFGSAGIAVEIGYYDTGSPATWASVAGPQMPPNDEPLMFWFTAQPFGQLVIKLSAGSEAARAGVLYIGKSLIMERGVDVGSDYAIPRFSRNTEFYNGRSARGDYLGRVVTSQWVQGVSHTYKHLTPTWYRSYFDPFVRAAQQDVPFFYAFAPDDYLYETAFVWLAEDPIGLTSPITDRIGVVLTMDGILE